MKERGGGKQRERRNMGENEDFKLVQKQTRVDNEEENDHQDKDEENEEENMNEGKYHETKYE